MDTDSVRLIIMKRNKGFSLLELMIAVAIVGIIASIAYPAYQEYVREARRSDAKAVLIEMSQWMEREYTVNGRYTNASNAAPSLPVVKSPKDGTDVVYNLGVVATSNTFTLTATPAAGGPQAGDDCGNLSITQTGAKSASGTATDCW